MTITCILPDVSTPQRRNIALLSLFNALWRLFLKEIWTLPMGPFSYFDIYLSHRNESHTKP